MSSYEISNRVHVARVYPVQSPNGSTPIIYGHDSGITIFWRGGLPLKEGDNDDDRFESDEEEEDPSKPYPHIIQRLDFPIGAEVLDISVPTLPPNFRTLRAGAIPSIFNQDMIIAVACTDFTVRLLLIPLVPPTNKQKKSRFPPLGDIVAEIPHTDTSSVCLTWTGPARHAEEEQVEGDTEMDADMAASENEHDSFPDALAPQDTNLLIASTSSGATGSLYITRVTLRDDGESTTYTKGYRVPFQRVSLPSTPLGVSFSPAAYPSKRHSQILVSHSDGTVRIYDPFISREAESEQGNTPRLGDPARGSWLASFSSGFPSPKSVDEVATGLARRKRILDAKWASGGRAIVVLLIDGEWGVWDVDGASPGGSNRPTTGSFALWGVIGSGIASNPSTSLQAKKPRGSRSSLAPMTPNTRRSKEESLFSGQSISTPTAGARGQISVTTFPLPSAGNTEDSIVFWYKDRICSIDSLQSFWNRIVNESSSGRGQASGGSLFGPGLKRIEGLDFHGQTITSLAQFSADSASIGNKTQEILVSLQHSLVILSSKTQRSAEHINSRLSGEQRSSSDAGTMQRLLTEGELDLGGLDAMMDRIDQQDDVFMSGPIPTASRRVGFAT